MNLGPNLKLQVQAFLDLYLSAETSEIRAILIEFANFSGFTKLFLLLPDVLNSTPRRNVLPPPRHHRTMTQTRRTTLQS